MQQIAIADGETQEFQLIKSYECMRISQIRKILKPRVDGLKIYCDEKEEKVEINGTTGVIKFAQAPKKSVVIRANGEFDVPVRFDIDHLVSSFESYGVYSHHEIPLVEIKL